MNCLSYDFAVSFCIIFPLTAFPYSRMLEGCCLLRYQPLTAPENIPLISCFCPIMKIEMDGMMIITTPAIIKVMDCESTLSSILIPICTVLILLEPVTRSGHIYIFHALIKV